MVEQMQEALSVPFSELTIGHVLDVVAPIILISFGVTVALMAALFLGSWVYAWWEMR